MANRLNEKVALVTGGSSGIGLATARHFAAEGATVYITGRKQEALDAAAASSEGNLRTIQADSSVIADLDRVYATIREKSGKLDVVFANAGIAEFLPLPAVTEEHYDAIVNTNLKGVIFTVRQAIPLLSEGASIILTSSTVGFRGMEALSVYSATKAAVRQLARNWIADLKAKKIRVNSLSPGMIDTPATAEFGAALKAHIASLTPLGRIGQPDDIAAAALFLASDESAFINGIDLIVDGGASQV